MGSDRTYSVEIAVQPPSVLETGVPIYPPVIVRVHTYDARGNEITCDDEMNSLFAQASLWSENGAPPSLAPPDMYLLSGRLSTSLDLLNDHPLNTGGGNGISPDTPLHDQQGSYAIFSDLKINRPGRYKLGISLFKVGDRSIVSNGSVSRGGGMTLEGAKSTVICVQDGSAPISIPDSTAQTWMNHIRNRGVAVPSPPR